MTRSSRFERASAKSREHIGALGKVEVAKAVVHQPGASGKGAAPQDMMRTEPRLGVFLVRIRAKARVRRERAPCPLPHAAHHVAQPPLAGRGVVERRRGSDETAVEALSA